MDVLDSTSKAARILYGPKGKSILSGKLFGTPYYIRSGANFAKEAFGDVNREGSSKGKLAYEVTNSVFEQVGDGTTTALLLFCELVHEGRKNTASGANPMVLAKGISHATEIARLSLEKSSRPVSGKEEIARIAIAAAKDEEIGLLIANAAEKAGERGIVVIEDSKGLENTTELVCGMRLDRGYISPYMVTDETTMEAVLENALILLTDYKISNPRDLLPLLEEVIMEDKCLFIIAEEIEGEALSVLITNKVRDTLLSVSIRAPEFGERRKDFIRDIAVMTGGTVVSGEIGLELSDARLKHLGFANKIIINSKTTTILGGGGNPEYISERIANIKRLMENADNGFDRKKLETRKASLSGTTAVVKIGAATKTELDIKREQAEKAFKAIKAAESLGVVAGAGASYLVAAEAIQEEAKMLEGDIRTGALVLANALKLPAKLIKEGFIDTKSDIDYIDSDRIVDPLLVCLTVLEKSVSVAGMLITAKEIKIK